MTSALHFFQLRRCCRCIHLTVAQLAKITAPASRNGASSNHIHQDIASSPSQPWRERTMKRNFGLAALHSHSAVQPSGAPLKRFNRSDALSDVLFIGAALLASIGAVGAGCLFALLF